MRRRAEAQEATRQRIVEATVALHEEIGPRATTVSAIAERAGVQRLTVYRHFPDEEAVLQACSSHWGAQNPPPDPATWEGIEDPFRRVRKALLAFYPYYAGTAGMWTSIRRDATEMATVRKLVDRFDTHVVAIGDGLAAGFTGGKRAVAQARATIQHALTFPTWQDLEALELDDADKAALVVRWLEGIGARPRAA